MSLVHGPTVVRTALMSAGTTFVLYVVIAVLAPTMLDLSDAASARGLVLGLGVLVRLLAGRLAARRTWQAGGDLPMVLASSAIGGLFGWLVFPGLLSVLGVLVGTDVGTGLAHLGLDLLVWLVCVCAGAASARWPEGSQVGPGRPAHWARRPMPGSRSRP